MFNFKCTNSSVKKHMHHYQTTKYRTHEIKWFHDTRMLVRWTEWHEMTNSLTKSVTGPHARLSATLTIGLYTDVEYKLSAMSKQKLFIKIIISRNFLSPK